MAHPQRHLKASLLIGSIYYLGQGVAIDYPRAMAAYKVGAEGGVAVCHHQLGSMYYSGEGVTPSWCRAREYTERTTELGHPMSGEAMLLLTMNIQKVS